MWASAIVVVVLWLGTRRVCDVYDNGMISMYVKIEDQVREGLERLFDAMVDIVDSSR